MPEAGGWELAQLAIQGIVIPISEAITVLSVILVGILATLVVPVIVLAAVAVENARCKPTAYYCWL
jgi:hypothetical protein